MAPDVQIFNFHESTPRFIRLHYEGMTGEVAADFLDCLLDAGVHGLGIVVRGDAAEFIALLEGKCLRVWNR